MIETSDITNISNQIQSLGLKSKFKTKANDPSPTSGLPIDLLLKKQNSLKKLRLLRLKNALKTSEVLEQFSPEKPKSHLVKPTPIEPSKPISDNKNELSFEIERVNNLPNLSPHVFEVLLKNIIPLQKLKPKTSMLIALNSNDQFDNSDQNQTPSGKSRPSFEDRLKAIS